MVKFNNIIGCALCGVLLSGCGDSDDPTNTQTDDTTQSLSGAVADGYLIGATVCLDLNENSQCDEGEPTATSGENGQYEIMVDNAVNTDDYPIVAEISASTIDEDTGAEVGTSYNLSAPPASDFVSPLTTMMQAALGADSNLTPDQAETLVLVSIGAPTDGSVSLLDDYVVNSDATTNPDNAADYSRVHDVARVTARVFATNQSAIEAVATEAGLDPESVMQELIDIVVAQVLEELSSLTTAVDEASNFDADTIAQELTDANGNLVLEEDASSIETSVTLEQLENSGTAVIASAFENGAFSIDANSNDLGVVEELEIDALTISNDVMSQSKLEWDTVSSAWVVQEEDLSLALTASGWVEYLFSDATATFNEDGTITITVTNPADANEVVEQVTVAATSVSLDGQSIANFVGIISDKWQEYITDITSVFSENAEIYNLAVTNDVETYLSWVDTWCLGDGSALAATGNCNSVWIDGQTATQLNQLMDQTIVIGDAAGSDIDHIDGIPKSDGVLELQRYHHDTMQYEYFEDGTWEYVTIGENQILVFSLPDSVSFLLEDWDDRHAFFVVKDGFVREGGMVPAGEGRGTEVLFNKAALQDLFNSLDVAVPLLPESI